ncbi:copper resistance protein CopC [Neobacillus sp. LXY-1]|uniref:copper resistance protein CopC n=1 Tax=Neobacillus sp. LXY-1 TaxID=3379133 RepID=UPI003EE0A173
MRRYLFLFISVIVVFLFLNPAYTSAHAYIIKSEPSENEILDQAPNRVSIQFDETIQPTFHSIKVFDSDGKQVDQKNGRIDPHHASIIGADLESNLPNGTYTVQWKVVSGDGHPVEGIIPFQIGEGENNHIVNQKSKGYTPGIDLMIIRWLQYISNAILVGMLSVTLFIVPKDLVENLRVQKVFSKLTTYSLAILCVSILLGLPLQTTIESGLSWGEVFHADVMRKMLTSSVYGNVWIFQVLTLIVLCAAATFLEKPLRGWISLILGIALLGMKAFTSHAGSTENVFLSVGMDFLHLGSSSIWIGSLVALIALNPFARNAETKPLYMKSIRTFSRFGVVIVLVLSLTGVYGSFVYIPTFRSLFQTDYGRILLGKVFLLIVMLVFAAVNFSIGKRNRDQGLNKTIWGELVSGLIVLVLSVILTNLPTAAASPGPINETKNVHGDTITFAATPNVIGKNTFAVTLKDRHGRSINNVEQVTLTFHSLDMEMGEATLPLKKGKDGKYEASGMHFNMAGRWEVKVHALTKDLEAVDAVFNVIVGSQ